VRLIIAALLACILCLAWASASAPVLAQTGTAAPENSPVVIDKRKLLVQPRNADGTLVTTPFFEDPVSWMREKQQSFYSRMSMSLRQLRRQSSAAAGWTLFVLSFLYGVFHAAGPGHGKAVISGWLLATENELKRGILIAFLSAMIQALTAIVVVSGLLLFVSGAAAMAKDAVQVLESASYLMIGGMGLYLVWTAWRGHGHHHGHAQASGTTQTPSPKAEQVERRHEGMMFDLVSRPASSSAGDPALSAGHIHDENCGCGHSHAPSAADVRGDWSLARAFALAFAVGVRPCSGAILVLIFSWPLGLYWAGIASVLAMGVGVFLTIAVIAALTVFAKGAAVKLAGADNPLMSMAVRWGKIGVGFAIAGLGLLLFLGSLGSNNLSM
jgi:ABC-type nickel/cobalt efflux system permease component RcnA